VALALEPGSAEPAHHDRSHGRPPSPREYGFFAVCRLPLWGLGVPLCPFLEWLSRSLLFRQNHNLQSSLHCHFGKRVRSALLYSSLFVFAIALEAIAPVERTATLARSLVERGFVSRT